MLRGFVLLVVFAFLTLIHGNVLPENYRSDRPVAALLEDRSPKGSKPKPPAPAPEKPAPAPEKPAPAPEKPAPAPEKPAPAPEKPKPSPAKPTPANPSPANPSPGKPSPNPSPKPSPSPSPKSSRSSAQPSSSGAASIPNIPVPYVDTAVDLCDVYIPCNSDEDAVKEKRDVHEIDDEHHHHGNEDKHIQDLERRTLEKRRVVRPTLPGGPLTLDPLRYPESGSLYTGARRNNPRNVYTFKDEKLGSISIRRSALIPTDTSAFATEHILELQTIGMFMEYACGQNAALDAFFRNQYVNQVPGGMARVNARQPRPNYTLGRTPLRDSLMKLVFEAMGTTANPTDFVMLEQEINSYKERLWSRAQLMDVGNYDEALEFAMKGGNPSADFLSALRLTFGVYGYMNQPGVVAKLRSINANIRLELQHAESLYNQPAGSLNLVPLWDTFIAQHFNLAEAHGRQWLTARMGPTMQAIDRALTRYRGISRDLRQKETGPNRAQHLNAQHQKRMQMEKAVLSRKRQTKAARDKIPVLRTRRRNAAAGAPKRAAELALRNAKIDLKDKERKQGMAERRIQELWSPSVNKIIKNLEKDKQRVATFRRDINGLNLTPP